MSNISFEVAEVAEDWEVSDSEIIISLRSKDKTLKLVIHNDDEGHKLIGQIMHKLGLALGGFTPQ